MGRSIMLRAKSISESISEVVLSSVIVWCIFPPLLLLEPLLDDDEAAFMFGVSAIFYMLVDPLFLYVPLINEETKCVMLDNRLKIAAIVLRSCGDLRYVQRIYLRIKDGRRKFHSLKKRIAMSVVIDAVTVLPVPQVVIFIFLPNMRGSRSLKIMKFLNSLILLQYLPRLYPIYKICKQVNKGTALGNKIIHLDIPIPKWFAIAVNIFGYILASHVLGACWYFFSIHREIDCWGYACRIENGCEFSTSCDENTFKNLTLLKNLCPINPPNATLFDFGIFLYALQSGMQASTNFPEKFLQCFLWGLRNLSSFASNLNTSNYGWENFFAVVIAIIGLVLFMYLLGHSQKFMQAAEKSTEDKSAEDKSSRIFRKMDIIKPKIMYMVSEYCLLPQNYYVGKIESGVQQILEDDENVFVQNIFSILKPWLQEIIKRDLCNWNKLWKVFINIEEYEAEKEIIENLEQLSYNGGSYIIREGEPLDMIFFIALGNVVTYSTKYDGSSSSSTTIELKKFEWYGEQDLIPWVAQSSSNLSNLPISTITIKSHTDVDVFAFKAIYLKNIASKFPGIFKTELHHSTNI